MSAVRMLLRACALAVLLAATTAAAQIPQILNYQGVLTDAAGTPVADGNYDLTFAIYGVPTGGAALWTETRTGVAVVRGGFSVLLGTTTALTLPFDASYWLGITVAPDPEMAPRVRLVASPYALTARGVALPFAASVGSTSPAFKVGNAGAGAAIVADGRLEVGSPTRNGDLALFRSGLTTEMLHSGSLLRGGYTDWYDEAGVAVATVEADGNGTGGHVQVLRDGANVGFEVDGNLNGSGEPAVTIQGSARSATFKMGNTGNASVVLPADAIGAAEILDEPGVASRSLANFSLSAGLNTIGSRAITVPADGWVLAMATFDAQCWLTFGNGQLSAAFGLSTSAGSLGTSNNLNLDPVHSLGVYTWPVTTQALFPVTAGTTTIYLQGQLNSQAVVVQNARLTLTYLPTAYGNVTKSDGVGDEVKP